MKQNEPQYITIFLSLWALLLLVAVLLTINTATLTESHLYDKQIMASNLSLNAMNEIKDKKEEMGFSIPEEDIYGSGLLGEDLSYINTTIGSLEAKRTTINPNFAAVFIEMLDEAGIKENDEVAVVMSGAFPALNISLMSALEVMKLKPCIMVTIGASSYGANDPRFTYYDMASYLNEIGLFKNKVDYVSLGGVKDTGEEFWTDDRNEILSRINENKLISEDNFDKNIDLRKKLITEKCPNVKMLINIGSSIVSLGKDGLNFSTGLIKPSYMAKNTSLKEIGLIETFLNMKCYVVHISNIKGLSLKYKIDYDPASIPSIGEASSYFEKSYNFYIPIIALAISFGLLGFYYVYRKKQI